MTTNGNNCLKITTPVCPETVQKTISVGITDKERGPVRSCPNRAVSYNKLTIQYHCSYIIHRELQQPQGTSSRAFVISSEIRSHRLLETSKQRYN